MSTTHQPVSILPGIAGEITLKLSQLATLEELGFREAFRVTSTRPINKPHISHLVESNASKWPPLKVVRVALNLHSGSAEIIERYGVVDGRHRWIASQKKKMQTIRVEVGSYANEDEVIQAALSANLDHGLPATTKTRMEYALWLYGSNDFSDLDIDRIAHLADVNASTIRKAIKRQMEEGAQDEEFIEKDTPAYIMKLFVNSVMRFHSSQIELFQRLIDVADYEQEVQEIAQEMQSHLSSLTPLLLKKAKDALTLTVDVVMTAQEK